MKLPQKLNTLAHLRWPKLLLSAACLSWFAVGCGGGSSSGSSSSAPITLTGSSNMGGVAASGAPLASAPFTITKLDFTVLSSGTVGTDSNFQATLNVADAPFIVGVTDTSLNPAKKYYSVVLASDFKTDASGKQAAFLNVTPLSTIVAQTVVGSAAGKTDAQVAKLRTDAANAVYTAIKPLVDKLGVKNVTSGDTLLSYVFKPTSDPFDKLLDTIVVDCNSAKATCTITPTSTAAQSQLGSTTLSIDTTSTAAAQTSAQGVAKNLTTVQSNVVNVAPVAVVFSAKSVWGDASSGGYTGSFTIYNFTDTAIDGGSQLYLESQKLSTNGFWNVASSSGAGKYLFTLPAWGVVPPKQAGKAVPSYTFGFNGVGDPKTVTDLTACNINGVKCVVLLDDKTLNLSPTTVGIRSWSNFVATLPSTVANGSANSATVTDTSQQNAKTDPTPVPNTNNNNAPSNVTPVTAGVAAQVVLTKSGDAWSTGFNGKVQLTNTSGVDWTSWSVKITTPKSITSVSSWGDYVLTTALPTVTFANASWNGALAKNAVKELGFGGLGVVGDAVDCKISYNDLKDQPCKVIASGANTNNTGNPNNNNNNTTPSTPVTPVGPPAPTPAPTPAPAPPPAPTPVQPNNTTQPTVTGAEPTTVAGSVKADQSKRVYVGYYPSWSDNWFSAKDWQGLALGDDKILTGSKLARMPGTYTHLVMAFAQPNFTWSKTANWDANTWAGTGLNFNAGPQDIRRAVDVLHARGLKVVVAVGGATYNSWATLAAENGSASGTTTRALTAMLQALDFDGLDVDYEVEGTNTAEYKGAVNAMRAAVDAAGVTQGNPNANNAGGNSARMLTVAGWSTGADCTAATGSAGCGGKTSYWGGKAGSERLVFSDPLMAAKIDMVSIMSYDARFENYDGATAWQLYRDLFPSKTIVNVGLETAPEGWAGGMLVVEDDDALCTGSKILQDQLGVAVNPVNQAYSVNRYIKAVMAGGAKNANARDGAMIWQVLKTATASCGTATVATPSTIQGKISKTFGLPADPRTAWQ